MGDHDWRPLLPDERGPEAHATTQTFYEEGPHAGAVAPESTKVGWTLRDRSNKIQSAFAFLINPQGINRTQGTRSQLFATKGGFYVDSFGPDAATIQLSQLVAHGKVFDGGFYTAREDVQRWLQRIYLPVTMADRGALRVFFHDHHFERGIEEEVYFPDNALALSRSVDLHNVWRLDLTMISLQRNALGAASAQKTARGARTRVYLVKAGDTFDKLARKLAGKNPNAMKVALGRDLLLMLNPQLKQKRLLNGGGTGKPMRVYPGEQIRLPG